MPLIGSLILSNLPAIISAGQTVMQFVRSTRDTMQQRQEWTGAHEAEFLDMLAHEATAPESQQDFQSTK